MLCVQRKVLERSFHERFSFPSCSDSQRKNSCGLVEISRQGGQNRNPCAQRKFRRQFFDWRKVKHFNFPELKPKFSGLFGKKTVSVVKTATYCAQSHFEEIKVFAGEIFFGFRRSTKSIWPPRNNLGKVIEAVLDVCR